MMWHPFDHGGIVRRALKAGCHVSYWREQPGARWHRYFPDEDREEGEPLIMAHIVTKWRDRRHVFIYRAAAAR